MREVVNLRLARKRKAREQSEQAAVEQRAKFGRTKSDARAQTMRDEIAERKLEGHRRAPKDEP